jgi:hypothetical protein
MKHPVGHADDFRRSEEIVRTAPPAQAVAGDRMNGCFGSHIDALRLIEIIARRIARQPSRSDLLLVAAGQVMHGLLGPEP